jgi:hypothetical protein
MVSGLLEEGAGKINTDAFAPAPRFIQATCATSGDGLYEGLEWVSALRAWSDIRACETDVSFATFS